MSIIRNELNTVNERLNQLEGKGPSSNGTPTQNTPNKGINKGKDLDFQMKNPLNNNGLASAHERARRDIQRKTVQNVNDNGKRGILGSGDNTSSSNNNNNVNLNKNRKIVDNENNNNNNQRNNNHEQQNVNEMDQLRSMLNDSNARSLNLEAKLNQALEMLSQQTNQQNQNHHQQ
jgi:hypothetical protein